MKIDIYLYVFILLLYVLSLISKISKKKFNQPIKKVFRITNYIAIIITCILFILWSFRIHVINLTVELLPFWIFISSSIILFGLTKTSRVEKIYYGIIFYAQLFFSAIIFIIPGYGILFTLLIYLRALVQPIIYENDKLILTEETIMPMTAPKFPIYFKYGFFLKKHNTKFSGFYDIDSLSIKKIDSNKSQISIYIRNERGQEKTVKTDTIYYDY